jgi:hypothetical protein
VAPRRNGTREAIWVNRSQPSRAGSVGMSGKPPQPCETYSRWASRSTCAQDVPPFRADGVRTRR